MTIINLIKNQQTNINIVKRNLNKLFWSSVTNLRVIRCESQGVFGCSVRNYHDHDSYSLDKYQDLLEREKQREELNNRYKISWTKDYKNLNNLLSIKGLDSNELIDENNIRYLVFSLTNNKDNLSAIKDKNELLKTPCADKDIFYSVSLILQSSGIRDEYEKQNKKWLYKIILSKLQENSSLIKEGGHLDIYYITSSELEDNVKEGYRYEDGVEDGEGNLTNYTGIPNKKLIPSISEVITLNKVFNNKLTVNIYVFTCETFFREYLNNHNVFYPYTSLDRRCNKLWAFPILIIEEMTLSTVTYLFKEKKLNLHGMSTTRRHKLSPLHKNLSNFLYITDLDDTIQKTHLIYIDKIYTNNKIDPDLQKNIYEIHKDNFKTFLLLKEDIKTIQDTIQALSDKITNTNIANQSPQIKKESEFNFKRLNFLNNKLENLNKQSMSPKVIIFMLRNQIFNLELEKLSFEKDKDSNKKDSLSEYNRINLEIDQLITEKSNIENNHNIIIDTLNYKVKNLELEILNLEKLVYDERTEIDTNRGKTLEYDLKLSLGKSKKSKKEKRKEIKLENERLNHQINLQQQQITNKNLEKKDVLYELDLKQITRKNDLEESTQEIYKKQQELEASNLKLTVKNKVLDKLNKKLDLINNISFSEDLVNSINNRKNKK